MKDSILANPQNLAKKSGLTRKQKNNILGWSLAILPVLGFLIFTFIPLVMSAWMSFQTFPINNYQLSSASFAGIENYKHIFVTDSIFRSLGITLLFCLSIPFEVFLGVIIANLLVKKTYAKRALRVIFFLPNICSIMALAFVWQFLYDPTEYGLLNQLFSSFTSKPILWLTSKNMFIPSIIIMTVWNVIGYDILLFQAALGNINNSYYEAANLDGANEWVKFFKITLPLATPTIFFLVLMGLIGGMQSFARMDSMNTSRYGYGPDNIGKTLVAYIMSAKNEPQKYGGIGVASAASLFTGVIIAGFTLINQKLSKKWVHYND